MMGQEWYVRVGDKVFGPHSPAKLRKGAETGKLSPDTLVRQGEEGPWIEASRIQGLFSNTRSENTSLSEATQADGWYFQVMGETHGPVTTEGLMELSRNGSLGRETDVKHVTNGEDRGWAAAESLPELSELFSPRAMGIVPSEVFFQEDPAVPSNAPGAQPPYVGARVSAKLIDAVRREVLLSEETIEAIIAGEVREFSDKSHGGMSFFSTGETRKGGAFKTHLMVVTDHRVVLWGRGTFRSTLDSFEFQDIRSVELQKGVLLAAIVLNVGKTENFALVQKKDAEFVCNLVRSKIAASRSAASEGPTGVVADTDLVGQLERLAGLHAQGQISAEQFETMKQKLIS